MARKELFSVSLSGGLAVLTLVSSLIYFGYDLKADISSAADDSFRGSDMDRFIERLENAARWHAADPSSPLDVPGWRPHTPDE